MKLLITILAALVCCSVSAQTGTADTIYVDVPAEVEALRMQTIECIAIGKKDKEVRAEWAKVATGSVTQEETDSTKTVKDFK